MRVQQTTGSNCEAAGVQPDLRVDPAQAVETLLARGSTPLLSPPPERRSELTFGGLPAALFAEGAVFNTRTSGPAAEGERAGPLWSRP